MQRLLSLGQRRPPFPSGFFNHSSSSSRGYPTAWMQRQRSAASGGISSTSSSRSSDLYRIEHAHHFSDSSRSRPPPSNKSSSGGGGGGPAKPAGGAVGSSSNSKASSSSATASNSKTSSSTSSSSSSSSSHDSGNNVNDASSSSVVAPSERLTRTSTSPGSSRKARQQQQRATSRQANGGSGSSRSKKRIDPFSNQSLPSLENEINSETSSSWLPRSIEPVEILRTHPARVTLDGFYSMDRPLLEVTIPLTQRRSIASQDKKAMEIVGEGEFSEQDVQAAQQYPEEQIGEYDVYLVTEPEGADPEWAEGTDKHMAVLEHNVAPPVPSSSSSSLEPSATSSSASTSSNSEAESLASTRKKSSAKKVQSTAKQQREHIDYLFPYQAEARTKATTNSNGTDDSNSLGAQLSRLLGLQPGQSRQLRTNVDPTAGTKFLVGHLMKHKWSGMWEWEPVRKALAHVESKVGPSANANNNAKGKAKATAIADSDAAGARPAVQTQPSLQKSVDNLGRISRARSRVDARNARRGRFPMAMSGSNFPITSPSNGAMLTAANGAELQQLIEQLTNDPKSQGKTIFISLPVDGDFADAADLIKQVTSGSLSVNDQQQQQDQDQHQGQVKRSKAAKAAARRAAAVEREKLRREFLNTPAVEYKEEALPIQQQHGQGQNQKAKFMSFFDKNIDAELPSKQASEDQIGAEAESVSPWEDEAEDLKATMNWSAESQSLDSLEKDNAHEVQEEEEGLDHFLNVRKAHYDLKNELASLMILGSRLSTLQANRGRSLRPTLQERLFARGVELEGEYKWIEMDSVKRKRRKRISKHKYKKRRKATRAERRKAGK